MKNFFDYVIKGHQFTLAEENGFLTNLHFGKTVISGAGKNETALLRQAAVQLGEYFCGQRRYFDIPLKSEGTVFQKKVWAALCEIPYGETRSYKEIAIAAGSPHGFRAAGMANNRNPIVIMVPCHRVIGTDGKLVGFGGGLDMKRELLELEQKYK